jgi:hypothetical protein
MKRIAAIFAVLALFPAVTSASQDSDAIKVKTTATPAEPSSGSRVYLVSGNVFVTQGDNPTHKLANSEPIVSNTVINTGDGSTALLKFEDGETVTMQANSILNVREYLYDAKRIKHSSIVFSMLKGGMRFITGLIGKLNKQAFRLSTPNATIGIRGTEFMVAMADQSMYSQVLKGKIAMTNAAGMKVVGAGHTAVVASSATLASLVSASAIPAGTFSELLSIPVQPSAIPAPAPEPAAATAPVSDALSGTASVGAAAGGAANIAAAATGIAGGAMAGMAGSDSGSAATETVTPAASPEESSESAKAADANPMNRNSRSDLAVTGKIGTLGLGAELDLGLTDSLGARIGLNAFTYKYNATSSTVNYDFNLQMQTVSALADWYPFEGSFRTSAGVMYNNNKVSLGGLPTGGTYTINGNPYSSNAISSLQGDMSFNKVAPYIGIGWGNPAAKNKGWGFTSDIGVLFQGSPKTSLTVTCTGTGLCPTANDIAAENTKLQNDLSNFKWWPVVSVGISYQW